MRMLKALDARLRAHPSCTFAVDRTRDQESSFDRLHCRSSRRRAKRRLQMAARRADFARRWRAGRAARWQTQRERNSKNVRSTTSTTSGANDSASNNCLTRWRSAVARLSNAVNADVSACAAKWPKNEPTNSERHKTSRSNERHQLESAAAVANVRSPTPNQCRATLLDAISASGSLTARITRAKSGVYNRLSVSITRHLHTREREKLAIGVKRLEKRADELDERGDEAAESRGVKLQTRRHTQSSGGGDVSTHCSKQMAARNQRRRRCGGNQKAERLERRRAKQRV